MTALTTSLHPLFYDTSVPPLEMVKYIASPLLYNSVSNVQRRRNATEMCEVMSAKGSSIIPKHSFRPQHSEQVPYDSLNDSAFMDALE